MSSKRKSTQKLQADKPVICVFGSNEAEGQAYELAQAVGAAVAGLGYVLANGGYGGTMEASARGAKAAGGRTVGVTCSLWDSRPNQYIDEVIVAENLTRRLETLLDIGRGGYIVLPGATGTLVEFAAAWEMMLKGLLPRRPLVCVGRFWQCVIDLMAPLRPGSGEFITVIDHPRDLPRAIRPADA